VVAGVVMMYVAYETGGMLGSVGFSIGASLALGGLSQLLFPPPTPATRGSNYSFGGPLNTSDQGNPVPVLYGRLIVGSQVISSAFSTDQIAVGA
jgi:predicted phage tail protein